MPGPVFIVFIPHKALAEIDPATGAMAAIEKAMNEENLVFAVTPEMSYPRPEWVAQDPAFWGRKATASSTTAPSKPGS